MKIYLDNIPEHGINIDLRRNEDHLSEALQRVSTPTDLQIDPCLTGTLRVFEHEQDIFLTGSFQAVVHLQCARCLKWYDVDGNFNLNVLIRRREEDSSIIEEDPDAPEDEIYFVEGDEFDPGDLLVQEILLEMPMKPLCSEDCQGLCSQCGQPVGSDACRCPAEKAVDPRWEPLAKLKEVLDQ